MVTLPELQRRLEKALSFTDPSIELVARLIVESDMGADATQNLRVALQEGGLGRQWNKVLNASRSKYLAEKIMSYLPEPNPTILDVLSGTGTLAKELRLRGCTVIETERFSDYGRCSNSHETVDFSRRQILQTRRFDAVIVVASIHHELSVDPFIGWMSTLHTNQYLIIENLRTEDTDCVLHERMDWFFNRCLNDFGAECPGWYWDKSQWEMVSQSLGDAHWLETIDNVPGIPFSYDSFLVNP